MRQTGHRTRIAMVCGAAIAVSIAAASPIAAEPTIKEQMGENFAGLQAILTALISSNYASIPAQTAVLRHHADQLIQNVPASAQGDRDRFLGLALSLKTNAESLASISELLARRDAEKLAKARDPGYDALRESLAGHYGGMVVTCVSCHNYFRSQLRPQAAK